jgi:hypothetical protein
MEEFEVVINSKGKAPLVPGKTYKVTAEIKGIFEKLGIIGDVAEPETATEPETEELAKQKPKK